jgi:transcriptional regulator of heat shock response
MLSTRQATLLHTLIKEYIDTAKAVSSGQLVDRHALAVSPATLRNDMAALTDDGYLLQPHTSAGRIPTEKAWRWYISQEPPEALTKREQALLRSVVDGHRHQQDELLRQLAKTMAGMVEESVLVAYGRHDTFYTGLSNLFAQPEFEHVDLMQSVSRVVDRLDDVVAKFYDRVGAEPSVLVGRENPFSHQCGAIIVRYRLGENSEGLIGILGPVRQDYPEHLALIRYATSLLDTI